MTKKEYIERYGIEAYEAHNAKCRIYSKDRYDNDPEYRESYKTKKRDRYANDPEYREYRKTKNRERSARYVKDGRIDLIENYELAKADNFNGWHIHHKLELNNDYINSMNDLKLMNLYYDRPPEELIWLTKSEHRTLHIKMRNLKK